MNRALLWSLLFCTSCSVWHDRATLELRVRGTPAECLSAQRRVLLGLPMVAPDDQERQPQPDGGVIRVTGSDAVRTLEREFAAVKAVLLAPPAGRNWQLHVRLRTSSLVTSRWQEWSEMGGEPLPTSRPTSQPASLPASRVSGQE